MTPLSEEITPLLALQLTPGAGHVTVGAALAIARQQGVELGALLGKPLAALRASLPPGCEELAEKLAACTPTARRRAKVILDTARARGVSALVLGGQGYPTPLAGVLGRAAPPVLYAAGNLALLQEAAVGIVGTRRPTEQAKTLTEKCARLFAEHSVTVVSGGAQGVDTAAQEAAWLAEGTAIVVLPMGLLHYVPTETCRTALEEGRAVLVSEFSPDAPWLTHAAVTRNATISALSRFICLVEPGKPGGSLLTAKHALAEGKSVFYFRPNEAGAWLTRHASAEVLLDNRGALRRAALLHAWEAARCADVRQTELWGEIEGTP